jgi:site-specific recombinase XerD
MIERRGIVWLSTYHTIRQALQTPDRVERELREASIRNALALAASVLRAPSWPAGKLHPFQARRADIECFARDLEARGRARATITRRLCTVAGFYRYAVEEELLDHSPAAHVRRPAPGLRIPRHRSGP